MSKDAYTIDVDVESVPEQRTGSTSAKTMERERRLETDGKTHGCNVEGNNVRVITAKAGILCDDAWMSSSNDYALFRPLMVSRTVPRCSTVS